MRKTLWLTFLSLASFLMAFPAEVPTAKCEVQALFVTPDIDGTIRDALLNLISQAQSTIDVAIYSFSDDELAAALIEAHERGVRVWVMMEATNVNGQDSKACKLVQAGIPVKKDTKSGAFHHKFIVIDETWVVTGSYNWSAAANDANYENAVILQCSEIAEAFALHFERYLWPSGQEVRLTEGPSHESWCPGCTCLERLNKATAKQFEEVHGIGPTLAQRIIQYRAQIGGFQSLEQLKVKGIGEGRLEAILRYFCPELFGNQATCTDP